MRILITSDHAGFPLKGKLYQYLKAEGYDVTDFGPHELDPDDDYPDYVAPVAESVSDGGDEVRGIIIGGSGQGEAMMANRYPHVRAAVFNGQFEPKDKRKVPDEIVLTRVHNDSNVLALGARFINIEEAKEAVKKWLDTKFPSEARHERRIKKIEELSPKGQAEGNVKSIIID